MHWPRLAAAVLVPAIVALPALAICWRTRSYKAAVLLAFAISFIGFIFFSTWDFGEALTHADSSSGNEVFTRIVIYGFIAMAQTMAAYLLTDAAETRRRAREIDPAWR